MLQIINKLKESKIQRYFFNSSWLAGEKVLKMIVGLFVGAYVARYLGSENFGILNYSLSFVALFAAIAALGLEEIVIRELVKYPEKRDIILGTSFILKCIGAFLLIILIILTFPFGLNDKKTNVFIFIIALGYLFQPFFVIDHFFQAQVKAKYFVIANIISLVISSLIRLVLIFSKASLVYFVLVTVVELFLISSVLIYFYKKHELNIFNWSFDKSLAKELLLFSWPLIFSSIFIMIYIRIDQIMIKEMLDFKSVGYYSVAVRISELWYFIPLAITQSVYPSLINIHKVNPILFIKRLQKLYDLLVWISVFVGLFLLFTSKYIINLLFGSEFLIASQVLNIHIWTGVFVSFGVARSKWLILENLQKFAFIYIIIGVVVNICLNLILIPFLGILGAAYSALLTQFVVTFLAPLLFPRVRVSCFMFIQTFSFLRYLKK